MSSKQLEISISNLKLFFGQHQSQPRKVSPELSNVKVVCSTSECSQPWLMRKASWKKRTKRQKIALRIGVSVHMATLPETNSKSAWKNWGLVNEAFPKFWEPALHSRCCVSFNPKLRWIWKGINQPLVIVLERRNSYELGVFERANCNSLFLFPTKVR